MSLCTHIGSMDIFSLRLRTFHIFMTMVGRKASFCDGWRKSESIKKL